MPSIVTCITDDCLMAFRNNKTKQNNKKKKKGKKKKRRKKTYWIIDQIFKLNLWTHLQNVGKFIEFDYITGIIMKCVCFYFFFSIILLRFYNTLIVLEMLFLFLYFIRFCFFYFKMFFFFIFILNVLKCELFFAVLYVGYYTLEAFCVLWTTILLPMAGFVLGVVLKPYPSNWPTILFSSLQSY